LRKAVEILLKHDNSICESAKTTWVTLWRA